MRQSDISEARLDVRPARPEEAERLADLWVAAWDAAWAMQQPPISFATRRAWLLDILADPGNTILIADADGCPVGFAVLAGCYLHQLVVAPDATRRGHATRLLQAAAHEAGRPLELDVNVDNPAARAFYARHGFAEIGRGRNAASGLETLRLRAAAAGP